MSARVVPTRRSDRGVVGRRERVERNLALEGGRLLRSKPQRQRQRRESVPSVLLVEQLKRRGRQRVVLRQTRFGDKGGPRRVSVVDHGVLR